MLKEPEVIHEYNQVIQEQVNKGIVEKVDKEDYKGKENERVHYVPHHAEIRTGRETKHGRPDVKCKASIKSVRRPRPQNHRRMGRHFCSSSGICA